MLRCRLSTQLERWVVDIHLMSNAPIKAKPAGSERGVIAYHITMRLSDDHGIARTPETLRLAARIIYRHGVPIGLFAFRIADTHLHVIVMMSRDAAGRFARNVQSALKQSLGLPVPFERARIRPIRNERHLQSALSYLFRQEQHHGTSFDPAHEGSSLPELLGMRHLDGGIVAERVRRALPRLDRRRMLEWLGISDLETSDVDAAILPEAAAAAFGLSSLHGVTRQHAAARHATAWLATTMTPPALTKLLRTSGRTLRRLRATPLDPSVKRAVTLQWRLRSAQQRANALPTG